MHICSECGQTIPEDSDFCHYCGALKMKAFRTDEKGDINPNVCHSCGAAVERGQNFCRSCGAALMPSGPTIVPIRMKKYAPIALLLALIPGFFHIYGLGHLVMKQWLRGGMFLAMTVILFFVGPSFENQFVFLILDMGVFLFQMMDVMKYMYESDRK